MAGAEDLDYAYPAMVKPSCAWARVAKALKKSIANTSSILVKM